MTKCGACGKFLPTTGVAVCTKCKARFHKACVTLSTSASIPKDWTCPCCIAKVPRKDNSDTPVKGMTNESPKAKTELIHAVSDGNLSQPSSRPDDLQLLVSPVCREETIAKLITEIRMFREDLQRNREEMATFRQEMHTLKDDIVFCKTKVNDVAQKIINLDERIQELERERSETLELRSTIEQLKYDLNEREQSLLINDVEIVNIPETKNENLYHMLSVLATTLGTTCPETDIVEVFRAGPRRLVVSGGPPAHPRPVVVRVTRRAVKDRLLRAARVRRNVTTADVSLPGQATKIYINERLTKENRRLFKRAKEEAKRLNWRFVWTKNGKIYARKADGSKLYSLPSDDDIDETFRSEVQSTPTGNPEQESLPSVVDTEPVSHTDEQTIV